MKDRKFLVLIVVSIGVIIGLAVVGFLLYLKPTLSPPPPSLVSELPPKVLPTPEKLLVQFENCLTGKEDPPLNPKASWPDTFYTIVKALSQRNEESCLKLEAEEKNECLKYFYIFKTLTENDVNYCEKSKLVGSANDYQMCLALVKNNQSSCQSIENSLNREICLALLKKEPDYCNHLSGTFVPKNMAYVLENYGVEGKKIKIEKKEISAEEARNTCKKTVYFIKALEDKNPTICNSPEFKGDPFKTLICQILSTPEPEKEWQNLRQKICYEKFGPTIALLKNDPSFCEKIPAKDDYNQTLYNGCLAQIK